MTNSAQASAVPGPRRAEADIRGWLRGRLPDWFTGEPAVTVDREEILIIGTLPPVTAAAGDGATPADDAAPATDRAGAAAEEAGRISRFREDTRGERMGIARELQHRADRTVSWGVTCGETTKLFTHLAAPIMTRLRQPERRVLDTLVESGVARSRADALAWSVRLVGAHTQEWLDELRSALGKVDEVRDKRPAT